MSKVICPYCGSCAELKDSIEIYGKSFGLVYVCVNYPTCDSFVGVHKNTFKPKGSLANRELRLLRRRCHTLFDDIWKDGRVSRKETYRWLSDQLGIGIKECHFGMFREGLCRKALQVLYSSRNR